MLESYSVALNIKEVRSSSQVLFFQIHPENRITTLYLPILLRPLHTFPIYFFFFSFFRSTFCLNSFIVELILFAKCTSSVPRKFIGKYLTIRTNFTILLTFWFLVAKPSFSLWSNANDMHQLDQALVQISKVFSDITGTTEHFDKIKNTRYFENKQHYEICFDVSTKLWSSSGNEWWWWCCRYIQSHSEVKIWLVKN